MDHYIRDSSNELWLHLVCVRLAEWRLVLVFESLLEFVDLFRPEFVLYCRICPSEVVVVVTVLS